MTNSFPFTDLLTGDKFDVETNDVYSLTSVGTGTMIKFKNGSAYIVAASFGCVCRELGYCEED